MSRLKTPSLPSLALLSLALLSACSSAPKHEQPLAEALITNITDDGLKQFTYEYAGGGPGGRPAGGGPGGGGPGGGAPGGRSPGGGPGMGGSPPEGGMRAGGGRPRDDGERVLERLSERLQSTGFCEHGWFVIRKEERDGVQVIVGECKSV
ncbi:hypothetical protein [Halioxenophilus sp. WMMB6]|uniref:hypothetical protein n=1 Tax=Halioxenophilus sp. WMMB6 TaxID=3073815 RepID=UPI00295F5270|nr:hypothetical protein [Halioxenophilus sp. WMMB6]